MEIKCKNCGAFSERAGQCGYCLNDLGDVKKAIIAALLSAAILFIIWSLIAMTFFYEFGFFALIYGVVISGSILLFANGSGPKYQLIATIITVVSIFLSDMYVTWFLWSDFELDKNSSIIEQFYAILKYQFLWDPFSWFFPYLGVFGGFYIWKYNF